MPDESKKPRIVFSPSPKAAFAGRPFKLVIGTATVRISSEWLDSVTQDAKVARMEADEAAKKEN